MSSYFQIEHDMVHNGSSCFTRHLKKAESATNRIWRVPNMVTGCPIQISWVPGSEDLK